MNEETLTRVVDVVRKVRRGLNSYGDLDERQIESCAVEPILAILGWEPFPWERRNQYRIDNGRKVDIALGEFRDEVMNPRVFLECKRPGRLSISGEMQLFAYAHGRGIPILVLTDGKRWDLYLSMARGKPPERKFESVRLMDEAPEDAAEKLYRYLDKAEVLSNRAATAAEQRRQTSDAIQRVERRTAHVLATLLKEPHETILNLIKKNRVEGLPEGLRPDRENLRGSTTAFLRRQASLQEPEQIEDVENRRRAPANQCRWRHQGEKSWRYSGRQATAQMGIIEDVLSRRFAGDGAALAAAYRAGDSQNAECCYVDLTANVPEGQKRYFKPVGDGSVSTYTSLSWTVREPILKRVMALDDPDSPLEIEHGSLETGEDESARVWKRIQAV